MDRACPPRRARRARRARPTPACLTRASAAPRPTPSPAPVTPVPQPPQSQILYPQKALTLPPHTKHPRQRAPIRRLPPDPSPQRPKPETVINAYKALDDTRTADISAKYKALKDAAGGDFPIDGKQFATNAEKMLGKDLKTDFLPPAIAKQLDRYKNGETMTFENFEAMRTNLAAEMRKAERSGDGNAKTASSIVRTALEELPLTGEAEALKPLANEARSAAKARFDMLKKDPAYDAAVNDAVPDKFINKYIIGGNKRDLEALTAQLGKGSEGHQAVSAAVVNYLKDKAGVINDNGNFSQAGYNKALKQLDPRLLELVDGETAQQLRALGNVARHTQAQPRGSYVNQSNTFVAGAKEMAKGGLEKAANLAGFGGVIPLGTMTREALANRAAAKQTQESLKPGAGTKLSDLGK